MMPPLFFKRRNKMANAVVKGGAYCLIHTPDMVIHNGTTQTVERITNPESEYLKNLDKSLRSYEEVLAYPPNQVYIGNAHPEDLRELEMPWVNTKWEAKREGKFGVILPQDEFLGLMKAVDVFDLVMLEEGFQSTIEEKVLSMKNLNAKMSAGVGLEKIEAEIKERHAEPLYHNYKLVGCVSRAHDVDVNLTSHVMTENLVVKASGVLALLNLLEKTGLNPEDIDYVIECSEEACGDMNQRGGGNFAKSIAEMCGCVNATGSDTRGFCAAPTHTLIEAASLVKSGTYKNVVMVAGGATAKLGLNGKSHVGKDLPILEDVLGTFAVHISEDDGVSPILRNDIIGRHTVGTGSSPQKVTGALVNDALAKANLKITDVDVYSVEMQNPDITKPSGAGDVPEANYKMIGALGVKRGDIEKPELANFIKEHGLPGWAPTQGHIPSGIPYAGFMVEDMKAGKVNRAMIVGKGSLFLGRMTNLFDGVSIVIEKNEGKGEEASGVSKAEIKNMIADAMSEFAKNLMESQNE